MLNIDLPAQHMREIDVQRENATRAAMEHRPGHVDRSRTPPAHTGQSEKEAREKRKHPASENELPSAQQNNPIPRGTTQRTSGDDA